MGRKKKVFAKIADLRYKLPGKNAANPQTYDAKLELHRREKRKKIILFIVAVLVFGTAIHIYFKNKRYDSYTVKSEIKLDEKYNSYFEKFGENVLKYSNDGAAYIDKKGEVWNQAFEMQNPMIDICGNYGVIADQNSNDAYIFNNEKSQGKVTMSYPIKKIEVASQGVVGAILEDKDVSYIEVRDKDGEVLTTGKSVIGGEGYPVDFTMSSDGKKMAVSYICVSGGKVQTRLLFYNFGEVGKGEIDNMVGGFNYKDSIIIPKVEFVNNDTVVAYGDNMISIYSMKEKPKKVWENDFDKEIKKVFYNDEKIGVIYYNSTEEKPFNVIVYDLKGKKQMDYTYTRDYDNVVLDGENVVLYDESEACVVSFAGREKYCGDFSDSIVQIVPTGKEYRYFVVTNEKVMEVKLK